VGHRVVHGGTELTAATAVTAEVLERIAQLTPLAPLHQPRAQAGIVAAIERLPEVAQVACFDTAFHATLPRAARTYALPATWRARWDLRRHGFHGLSHAWAAGRARSLLGPSRPARRIVTCHLGAGASLCAVLDGRSVDTTMGFTPLEGLVMATRSGSVDPGLVLWLLTEAGLDAHEVTAGLERDGGLAGLTGTSGDMREVLAARGAGDVAATEALEVYVHRLRREISAMAAALGGLDALVFTGGVGEHTPEVRAAATEGLGFLGVAVDPAANEAPTPDADISPPGATVRTLVVASREDLQIAGEVRDLLS
jgi:acetate kinase